MPGTKLEVSMERYVGVVPGGVEREEVKEICVSTDADEWRYEVQCFVPLLASTVPRSSVSIQRHLCDPCIQVPLQKSRGATLSTGKVDREGSGHTIHALTPRAKLSSHQPSIQRNARDYRPLTRCVLLRLSFSHSSFFFFLRGSPLTQSPSTPTPPPVRLSGPSRNREDRALNF